MFWSALELKQLLTAESLTDPQVTGDIKYTILLIRGRPPPTVSTPYIGIVMDVCESMHLILILRGRPGMIFCVCVCVCVCVYVRLGG